MSSFNKPLAFAISSAILSGLTSSAVNAKTTSDFDKNPFTLTELSNGYMQLAKSDKKDSDKVKDGACGEGSCGAAMMKGSEEKTAEGNCAGNKPIPTNNKSDKSEEGKCGDGKCGAAMK
jgi:uncharacterized low-complexity protein